MRYLATATDWTKPEPERVIDFGEFRNPETAIHACRKALKGMTGDGDAAVHRDDSGLFLLLASFTRRNGIVSRTGGAK